MFIFKKIITPLFLPMSLCLILLLTGIFLLWFTQRQKTGKLLVSAGAILLLLLSCGDVSNKLIAPLEYKYPPLSTVPSSVKWIVVLGGGHVSDSKLPVSSQISRESLVRLTEAVRLHREMPQSRLVLSGGKFFDKVPEAQILYRAAKIMNVSPSDMIMESSAKDTEEQARLIRAIVKKQPFILVTSASHMPRAIALFKKYNLSPIPAPTGHLAEKKSYLLPRNFYPLSENIYKAELALHEYLGIIWLKIKNAI